MPLTDATIRAAKIPAGQTQRKLFDEMGLYLLVKALKNGSVAKWWRQRYTLDGLEKGISLGRYPATNLALARKKRDANLRLLAEGIDPSAKRQADKIAKSGANSFEAVAREWHARQAAKWSENHVDRVLRRLELDVFPWVGKRPIGELACDAPSMLTVLRRVEARGATETAHRAHRDCSKVFRYAVATGRAERDPMGDLRGALTPVVVTHHSSITEPKAIGALLRDLAAYEGSFITRCALRLSPLVFVRPGELRNAQWPEFDLDGAEWRIPAARMKMKTPHIVPLSRQAVAVLRELEALTGTAAYLFPSVRSWDRPMSDNTVNAALRRLGYTTEEMTGHGFRSMASTILNEQGWKPDAIERQLAHAERSSVRAAYNYAEYLPERRKMMQAWADYLDTLEHGDVVPLRSTGGRS